MNTTKSKTNKAYTVQDVINTGITLEPIRCIHCNRISYVVYNQSKMDYVRCV